MTKLVEDAAAEMLGADNVLARPRPSKGSEHFAYYLERVPGTMFRLVAEGDTSASPELHTPELDVG